MLHGFTKLQYVNFVYQTMHYFLAKHGLTVFHSKYVDHVIYLCANLLLHNTCVFKIRTVKCVSLSIVGNQTQNVMLFAPGFIHRIYIPRCTATVIFFSVHSIPLWTFASVNVGVGVACDPRINKVREILRELPVYCSNINSTKLCPGAIREITAWRRLHVEMLSA